MLTVSVVKLTDNKWSLSIASSSVRFNSLKWSNTIDKTRERPANSTFQPLWAITRVGARWIVRRGKRAWGAARGARRVEVGRGAWGMRYGVYH